MSDLLEDVPFIEALAKLVVRYELESLEAGGVKVTKKLHRTEAPPTRETEPAPPAGLDLHDVDDELLFHSSMELRLSVEDLAKMGDKARGNSGEPQ